jgi:hypothetical protein
MNLVVIAHDNRYEVWHGRKQFGVWTSNKLLSQDEVERLRVASTAELESIDPAPQGVA